MSPIDIRSRRERRASKTNGTFVREDHLLFFLSLLLCGDVHPCPGPETSAPQESDFSLDNMFSSKGLNMLHLNVRSLLPKITEIRQLCNNSKVGLLCFSETWLDDSVTESKIEIENYIMVRRDRNRKGGGGMHLY